MTYRLSLLDKSPIAAGKTAADALATTVAYAQLADRLGYHRLWFAEHHGLSGLASAAPEILIAHLLARTRRIRLGSGGVLLQHYAPFKIAEIFSVLATIAPGRVDLAIGKAPGGFPATTRALQAETAPGKAGEFDRKLVELDGFLHGTLAPDHPLHAARPIPAAIVLPELFLLGGSVGSAEFAARLGWGFVHAGHHNGSAETAQHAISAFATRTRRGAVLAVQAFAAESRAEAERHVRQLAFQKIQFEDGHSVNLGSSEATGEYVRQYQAWRGNVGYRIVELQPSVLVGAAEDVHRELDRLHRQFGVDEFIIDQPVAEREARLRSIELIAHARALVAA